MQNFGTLRADYKLSCCNAKAYHPIFAKQKREGDRLVSRCFLVLPLSVPKT